MVVKLEEYNFTLFFSWNIVGSVNFGSNERFEIADIRNETSQKYIKTKTVIFSEEFWNYFFGVFLLGCG